MLQGLRGVEGGEAALPFVSLFYSSSSTYIWEDDAGITHTIVQGEGGEQGDPLMPALFAVGQHSALAAARTRLQPNEHLMAFHDDLYVVCQPERVVQDSQGGVMAARQDPDSPGKDPSLESGVHGA